MTPEAQRILALMGSGALLREILYEAIQLQDKAGVVSNVQHDTLLALLKGKYVAELSRHNRTPFELQIDYRLADRGRLWCCKQLEISGTMTAAELAERVRE